MKPKYRNLLGLTSVIAALTPTSRLMALDYTWTGATNNISTTATNWNPNGSPGTADNILVDTSTPNPTNIPSGNWSRQGAGTTTINGTGIVNLTAGSARLLNNGIFNVLGGQLVTNGEYFIVGSGGVGTFTQSGGSLDITARRGFFLSDGAGDSGSTFNLSNGTFSVKNSTEAAAGTEELRGVWFGKGLNGTGTDKFNVTGSTATFEKTGTATSNVQLSGSSELNLTTGTVTFDKYNEVRVGYAVSTADLQAKINVNSGTLNFTNAAGSTNVRIGYNDKGLLNVAGGVVNIKGLLGVGTTANTPLDAGEGTCLVGGTSAINVTGNLAVGTGGGKGILTMTGGTLTVTNTGVDVIGGGNNGNASVTLSGTSVLNAATTKWKTGDYGGNANAGSTIISLTDSAALTLKEFTIGHIGGASSTEAVNLSGSANLTVGNFITMGRDDNAATSGIVSSLNLNGGTLSTKYIIKGADGSDLSRNNINANGGTIKALATDTDFFKLGTLAGGRVYVNLQAGGLTFDTNGFDVGFQSGLHGAGGITKVGVGTLTLPADNDYTGNTAVSAGTLVATTGFNNLGSATLADGATLAIAGSPSASWNVTDLTLGSGTGASTLEIRNFDATTGTAAINASGALTTHGTVTVKIIGTPTLNNSPFPLINYGSHVGSSTFVLGALPRGVAASLVDTGSSISLKVTALNVLRWKGNVNSTWDINTSSNWLLGSAAAKYLENDNVTFDESTNPTSTAITLNTTVAPAGLLFNNTNKNYSIGGTGSITGTTALNKTGGGMLTLATTNTYTGLTTINEGTLRLGDGVTDGSLTGPLLLNDTNVIFNTTGTATLAGTLDGYSTGDAGLTKTGPGTEIFTGTTNTYSGPLHINQGIFQVGNGTVNGSIGSIQYGIASAGQLRLNYGLPASPGWSSITGAGVLALASTPSFDWGAVSLPAEFTGTLRVEKGRVGFNNGVQSSGGATKVQILSGAQLLAFSSADPYTIPVEIAGGGWGEAGYPDGLRLAGDANATWAGSVTLTADSGIMAQRNTNFTVTGSISGAYQCEFYVGDPRGDSGVLNVVPATGQNSYASTKINGTPNGSIVAGNANAFSTGPLVVASAVLKLNGFNFTFANLSGTGGKIGNFHAANPAVITVGGDNSSTSYAGVLVDGDAAPLGIVKTGTGTLSLSGANSYTGATTVTQGTLSITSPTLADTSTVSIAAGAHMDLSTGAADTVGVLILGGVTVPSGTYNSSHPVYGSYFTGTGSLVIAGGYSNWATAKGLDATNNGLSQDPDNDGMKNLLEFYLDGNPLASDSTPLFTQTSDATYLTLSFHRRDDANGDLTTQVAQYGSDLTGWTDVTLGSVSAGPNANGVFVDVVGNDTAPDAITVRIPKTNAVGGKLFGRLKVAK